MGWIACWGAAAWAWSIWPATCGSSVRSPSRCPRPTAPPIPRSGRASCERPAPPRRSPIPTSCPSLPCTRSASTSSSRWPTSAARRSPAASRTRARSPRSLAPRAPSPPPAPRPLPAHSARPVGALPCPPPPPPITPPGVPRRLAQAVERCLAKHPADRFQDGAALGRALAAALPGQAALPIAVRAFLTRSAHLAGPALMYEAFIGLVVAPGAAGGWLYGGARVPGRRGGTCPYPAAHGSPRRAPAAVLERRAGPLAVPPRGGRPATRSEGGGRRDARPAGPRDAGLTLVAGRGRRS